MTVQAKGWRLIEVGSAMPMTMTTVVLLADETLANRQPGVVSARQMTTALRSFDAVYVEYVRLSVASGVRRLPTVLVRVHLAAELSMGWVGSTVAKVLKILKGLC